AHDHAGDDAVAFLQAHQAHPLAAAADEADLGDRDADDHALLGDEDDVVALPDDADHHHVSVPLEAADVDDPEAAPALDRVLRDAAAQAVAVGADAEQHRAVVGDGHVHDVVALLLGLELHRDHTGGG